MGTRARHYGVALVFTLACSSCRAIVEGCPWLEDLEYEGLSGEGLPAFLEPDLARWRALGSVGPQEVEAVDGTHGLVWWGFTPWGVRESRFGGTEAGACPPGHPDDAEVPDDRRATRRFELEGTAQLTWREGGDRHFNGLATVVAQDGRDPSDRLRYVAQGRVGPILRERLGLAHTPTIVVSMPLDGQVPIPRLEDPEQDTDVPFDLWTPAP